MCRILLLFVVLLGGAAQAHADRVADRALLLAVQAGRSDLVAYALDNGASPSARAALPGAPTALMLAAHAGDLETVDLLIDARAPLDETDEAGVSALMLAAAAARYRVLRRPLAAGANVDAREPGSGNTALMLAANLGRHDLVDALLGAGADPRATATDGWTAAQAARMVGEEALARRLEALAAGG